MQERADGTRLAFGHVTIFYRGGAMAGRFAGSAPLARSRAAHVLKAAGAVLAIGLFHAIAFATIFTITPGRSTAPRRAVAGLPCVAIAGGAFGTAPFGPVLRSIGRPDAVVGPAQCSAAGVRPADPLG